MNSETIQQLIEIASKMETNIREFKDTLHSVAGELDSSDMQRLICDNLDIGDDTHKLLYDLETISNSNP